MKTITTWVEKHQFISRQENNSIALDGDLEKGVSPKALLLSGLAGCTGIDVVDILGKMKVAFSGLTVEAAAEQTEEHPRVFKDISLIFRLKTMEDNRGKVIKAINLSMDKYCGVAAMLRKNSSIQYELIIE